MEKDGSSHFRRVDAHLSDRNGGQRSVGNHPRKTQACLNDLLLTVCSRRINGVLFSDKRSKRSTKMNQFKTLEIKWTI